MTLRLLPGPPSPFRADSAREELLRLWEGMDGPGRRLILAHARAVSDVTGRPPAPMAAPMAAPRATPIAKLSAGAPPR